MSYTAFDLPQYIKNGDKFIDWENYFQILLQVLTTIINSNGFLLPQLTDAQATALTAVTDIPIQGRLFLNLTQNKLQFIGTDNALHTVTSS